MRSQFGEFETKPGFGTPFLPICHVFAHLFCILIGEITRVTEPIFHQDIRDLGLAQDRRAVTSKAVEANRMGFVQGAKDVPGEVGAIVACLEEVSLRSMGVKDASQLRRNIDCTDRSAASTGDCSMISSVFEDL